jgi:hypothetical protein
MGTTSVKSFDHLLQLKLQNGSKGLGPSSKGLAPRSRLQAAFTALGLDRVLAGVRSLYMQRRGWQDCFLAMAYGEAGELSRLIHEHSPKYTGKPSKDALEELKAKIADGLLVKSDKSVSRLLNIAAEHVRIIVVHFDADPQGFAAELESWLQERNVNAATVMAQARREASELKCPFHLCYSRQFVRPDSLKIP